MNKLTKIALLMSIITIMFTPAIVAGERWYIGGNLHKQNLGNWRSATYANRLATAGDMASSVLGANKVARNGGLPWLRIKATELVSCIDQVAVDHRLNYMAVAEVAAACQILMKWHR